MSGRLFAHITQGLRHWAELTRAFQPYFPTHWRIIIRSLLSSLFSKSKGYYPQEEGVRDVFLPIALVSNNYQNYPDLITLFPYFYLHLNII